MLHVEGPLRVVDRGISIVHYIRARPLAVGALTALFAAGRGRGVWKWAQRGFVAWRAYRAMSK
jgi:hypothetical protein